MNFGFKETVNSQEKISIRQADEEPVEANVSVELPAAPETINQSLAPEKQIAGLAGSDSKKHSAIGSIFSFVAMFLCAGILVIGQVFMVADIAVVCGTMSSALFGLSYDRVMFHCGPQDTYLGGFVLAAIPVFWTAWYLHKRKFLKYAAFALLGLPIAWLLGSAIAPSGLPAFIASLFTLAALVLFQTGGSYFSTFQKNWPRKVSVTRRLLICYLPAIAILAYEFNNLNLDGAFDQVTIESVYASLGIIAAFALLPAFLTAVAAQTKRFASAFGLAVIGLLPVIACALLYCIANGIMLASVNAFGSTAVSEYFARQAGSLSPDFDLTSSSMAELIAKFCSSLLVLLSIVGSAWLGSIGAVFWNRWRHHSN